VSNLTAFNSYKNQIWLKVPFPVITPSDYFSHDNMYRALPEISNADTFFIGVVVKNKSMSTPFDYPVEFVRIASIDIRRTHILI
jgi:hypothetical protein